jgi:hypothetical protein
VLSRGPGPAPLHVLLAAQQHLGLETARDSACAGKTDSVAIDMPAGPELQRAAAADY